MPCTAVGNDGRNTDPRSTAPSESPTRPAAPTPPSSTYLTPPSASAGSVDHHAGDAHQLDGGSSKTHQLLPTRSAPATATTAQSQDLCPICAKDLCAMGCFDCGAVEMECEDYPEHCDYSTGNCVCNDYNTLAPTTQAL